MTRKLFFPLLLIAVLLFSSAALAEDLPAWPLSREEYRKELKEYVQSLSEE